MVLSNGYIVVVDNRAYGPYLTFDDAEQAHKDDGDRRVQALNHNPLAINVKDCGRSECAHCRNTEREGRKAMDVFKSKLRREAASE
jgi:hypothetical protein